MRVVIATLGLVVACGTSGIASPTSASPWGALLSVTFRILADLPDLPVTCTGWFAAPRGHVGPMLVSAYVTAGHCDVPHLVRTPEWLEQMTVLARVNRPGLDAAVGAGFDPRAIRSFPVLAATLPHSGDRALVVGYSAGHLTEAVLTTLSDCRDGFICFHSDQALRPGMSGAPILSLRTGKIIGILVGTPLDSHGYGDPYTIWATSSMALLNLVELVSPEMTEVRGSGVSPLFPIIQSPHISKGADSGVNGKRLGG